MGRRPWEDDGPAYLDETQRLIAHDGASAGLFKQIDFDRAHQEAAAAAGPLSGMVYAVSKGIELRGVPTLRGITAAKDAEVVTSLRAAGAAVLGTTRSTANALPPATASAPITFGGTAAAVACGAVCLGVAVGFDDISLLPAAHHGVWGFKPSHGRFPRAGVTGLSPTLGDIVVHAAMLGDLAAAFDCITPPRDLQPNSGTLRVGIIDFGTPYAVVAELNSLISQVVDDEVRFTRMPHQLSAAAKRLASSAKLSYDIAAVETMKTLERERDVTIGERLCQSLAQRAAQVGAHGYEDALAVRERLRSMWSKLSRTVDLVVVPAPSGEEIADDPSRTSAALVAALLGIPMLSAPWLRVDGESRGVLLLGFEGCGEELISAAHRLDRARR